METTRHHVTAWENKDVKNLNQLKKGCGIHVFGRLRQQKYVAADGTDRIVMIS
ncbi:MAG: single-stranded DNA-binding protein [Bacteroidales bacterium]|nr:single-stranded DNA-binding protein [Bacteroidales bacterium]